MNNSDTSEGALSDRLNRFLGFVALDPTNASLAETASRIAFEERAYQVLSELLIRFEKTAELTPPLIDLRAQTAMIEGRWGDAVQDISTLVASIGPQPALSFNLAWCHAMMGNYERSLALLDEEVLKAAPRAPTLKVRMMHHLGLLDEALAAADQLVAAFPEDNELKGALATIAIDAEQPDIARKLAEQSDGSSHDAATALGTLKLHDFETDEAYKLFDHALSLSPLDPRAHVGKGLALLPSGQDGAAEELDRGAELFSDHIGSWIAAGWAHLTRGNLETARSRFEQALSLDDSFAESHGALAVADILSGFLEEGKRRSEVALRLDRQCFSAALAKSLLLERAGRVDAAEALRRRAMEIPIGDDGLTITKAVAGFGLKARKR